MKKILIPLLNFLIASLLNAYDGSGSVDDSASAPTSPPGFQYNENEELLLDALQTKKAEEIKSNLISKKIDKVIKKYFSNFDESKECAIENFKCPSLISTLQSSHVAVRTNIFPKTGKFQCQVFPKINTEFDIGKIGTDEPIYRKNFYLTKCQEKFSIEYDDSETSNQKRGIIKDKTVELQNLSIKYEESEDSSQKRLDTSDIYDAIASLDYERLHFENIISTYDLAITDKYTIEQTNYNLSDFENSLETVQNYINGIDQENDLPVNISSIIDSNNLIKQKEDTVAVFLIEYISSLTSEFWDISKYLIAASFFIFIVYFFKELIISFFDDTNRKKANSFFVRTLFYGIFLIALLGATATTKYELKDENGDVVIEYKVVKIRVHALLQELYKWTNKIADEFTLTSYKSYLSYIYNKQKIPNLSEFNHLTAEKLSLENENIILNSLIKKCDNIYDVIAIKDNLSIFYRDSNIASVDRKYFQKENVMTKPVNDILFALGLTPTDKVSFNQLELNPFPVTEKLAFAAFKQNPYTTKNSGALKANPQFDEFLKLSTCYETVDKKITNLKREETINKILLEKYDIDVFSQKIEGKVEFLNSIQDIVFQHYHQEGYWSIVYLPLIHLSVSSYVEFNENLNEHKSLTETLNTQLSESILTMHFFSGRELATTIDELISRVGITSIIGKVKSAIADKLLSKVIVEDDEKATQVSLFALLISAYILNEMLVILPFIVLLFLASIAFFILFFLKLAGFVSMYMLLIHVFSQNNDEKIEESLKTIISTAMKTIFYCFTITLSIIVIFLIDEKMSAIQNNFYSFNTDLSANAFDYDDSNILLRAFDYSKAWVQKIVISGFLSLGTLLLKAWIIYSIVFKVTNYIFEVVNFTKVSNSEDSMNSVTESFAKDKRAGGM